MINFLDIKGDEILFDGEYFFIIKDKFPVSPGHLLVISKALKNDYFDLSNEELIELPRMILKAKDLIQKEFSPHGYNIGMNCGASAGQTVMHFHCHIIPRYNGDMDDPRGGVRHSIKGKGYY
jgi:diadenosine tetraphosphate (Ap4A) HIT family hydrolase